MTKPPRNLSEIFGSPAEQSKRGCAEEVRVHAFGCQRGALLARGSDVIRAALALACGSVADLWLPMITIRLKGLPTAAATTILHLGGSGREWQTLILSGSALKLDTKPDN